MIVPEPAIVDAQDAPSPELSAKGDGWTAAKIVLALGAAVATVGRDRTIEPEWANWMQLGLQEAAWRIMGDGAQDASTKASSGMNN